MAGTTWLLEEIHKCLAPLMWRLRVYRELVFTCKTKASLLNGSSQ
jgi:hypothetical protein